MYSRVSALKVSKLFWFVKPLVNQYLLPCSYYVNRNSSTRWEHSGNTLHGVHLLLCFSQNLKYPVTQQ